MKNRTKNFYVTFPLIHFILVAAFLFGCAQPQYIQKQSSDSGSVSGQELQADCSIQFQNSKICLMWRWESQPTNTVMGSLILKTYRLNQLDQTAVETDMTSIPDLILWMPSMGHGSSPTSSERIDVGTYRMNNVFFIMPGDWDLKFQIHSNSEKIDEAIVSVFIN